MWPEELESCGDGCVDASGEGSDSLDECGEEGAAADAGYEIESERASEGGLTVGDFEEVEDDLDASGVPDGSSVDDFESGVEG